MCIELIKILLATLTVALEKGSLAVQQLGLSGNFMGSKNASIGGQFISGFIGAGRD